MLVFAAMLLLGILLGFVGVGGAGVMITMLSVGFDIPMQVALGTSLAAMAFTSLSGSVSHFREGNVNRRLGLLLGAFGAAGAFCGAHISSGLASATLKPLTGVVLMLSAFLIYLRVFHPANPLFSFRFTSTRGVKFWLLTGMVGVFNGLVSGACGVGATPFIQMTLLIIFNVPLYQTVGTTMLVILPIAAFGSLGFLAAGHLDLVLFLQVLAGQVIGAYVGAKFTRMAPQLLLKGCMVALPGLGGLILLLAR